MRWLCVFCGLLLSCCHLANGSNTAENGLAHMGGVPSMGAFVRAEDTTCELDSDCVINRSGCCNCMASGAQVAVNRARVREIESRITTQCLTRMCAQMISRDSSCQKRSTVCQNGQCALVD